MSELLFECYSVPRVCYGVDALFSLYENDEASDPTHTAASPASTSTKDALIVSCGFHTVHVIPVLNGEIRTRLVRRINVGGFHLVNCLHRGMQLKYSAHINNITVSTRVLFFTVVNK